MLIDVNSYIGVWPFRSHSVRTTEKLVDCLKTEGIDRAVVSSIEAALVADPDPCNQEVLESCQANKDLIPLPVLNLRMRNWPDLLAKYREHYQVHAVKIHPSFHYFSLDSSQCDKLCTELSRQGMTLVIDTRVEDERFRHPGFKVTAPDTDAITALARSYDDLSMVCLNLYRKDLASLVDQSNIYVDLAFLEFFKTVENVLGILPSDRILFGSNVPFFVPRAALMKLAWADISEADRNAISSKNAASLFVPNGNLG